MGRAPPYPPPPPAPLLVGAAAVPDGNCSRGAGGLAFPAYPAPPPPPWVRAARRRRAALLCVPRPALPAAAMGSLLSRRIAGVEDIDIQANSAYRYPPKSGEGRGAAPLSAGDGEGGRGFAGPSSP